MVAGGYSTWCTFAWSKSSGACCVKLDLLVYLLWKLQCGRTLPDDFDQANVHHVEYPPATILARAVRCVLLYKEPKPRIKMEQLSRILLTTYYFVTLWWLYLVQDKSSSKCIEQSWLVVQVLKRHTSTTIGAEIFYF